MRKTCRTCGTEKALASFYRNAAMTDGYLNECKVCRRAAVRENRELKAEYYAAYEAQRSKRPDRVAARAAYRRTAAGKAARERANKFYRMLSRDATV